MLVAVIGAPGLVLFAIGCPLLSAYFLYRNRHLHKQLHFVAVYNFMFDEYRST